MYIPLVIPPTHDEHVSFYFVLLLCQSSRAVRSCIQMHCAVATKVTEQTTQKIDWPNGWEGAFDPEVPRNTRMRSK